MPYSAPPPAPHPIVTVASAETGQCSSLSDSLSTGRSPLEPGTIANPAIRVAAPESFPPQAANSTGVAQKAGKSATANPTPQPPISCAALLKDSGTASATTVKLTTRLPSFKLSGATGKLANLPESTLMPQINQAIVFDALAESYQALSRLSAEDLRRLGNRDRANGDRPDEVSQIPASPVETFPTVPDSISPTEQPPLVTPLPSRTPTRPPAPVPARPSPQLPGSSLPVTTPDNVVEVTADRQEYDERNQIFTAEGRVMMRFRNALLEADRVQVNLPNRLSVAEGNVALTRGNQVLRGQRFEYNFVQGVGTVERARGDIFLPAVARDTALSPETAPGDRVTLARPISDRITSQQPIGNVSSPGGINFSLGAGRDINRLPGALPSGGEVRRLRFEAERIDFTPEGWEAQNIDITNDPFSPPELVLRANRATLTRISPLEDEVLLTRPRIVLDQRISLPFLRRRFVLSRAEQEPAFFRFGFDSQDRGGLFVEGIINVISTARVNFSIYPQIFLQRMFLGNAFGIGTPGTNVTGIDNLNNYGVRSNLDVFFSDRTTLRARAALTSLDPDQFENQLRASVRLEQLMFPTPTGFHRLGLEYSYRDRLFNGSLGFQTVQSSLGAVFQSPNIPTNIFGFVANYQVGFQLITADTDRLDLLPTVRTNNQVELGRFQATAGIGRGFTLWSGRALPPTPNEGLKYTPNPVTPQITLATTLRGVFSQYTSGDSQESLIGTVGLFAQFGHFSRPFFDYTAIGISYSQVINGGQSPFLFDRVVDNRILGLSFFQQVYGPVRVGVQTSINLDTREAISTDIFLEYSRRTHGIIVRYNPVLEIGSIGFRISDFNWTGTAEPFQGAGVVPVEGGLERR